MSKDSNKEYGRKSYISDKSFVGLMRETTSKAVWNTVTEAIPDLSEFGGSVDRLTSFARSVLEAIKQSERKKPWLSNGDYTNMEYQYEGTTTGIFPHTDDPFPDNPSEGPPPRYPVGPTGAGEGK